MTNAWPDIETTERDEQAAAWCLSLAEGSLDAADQAAFEAWIADPLNRAAFEQALLVWQCADSAVGNPEMIHARTQALESYRAANYRRWRRPDLSRRPRAAALAAIAAVLLLFALGGAWHVLRDPAQLYETDIGERRVALLDDGSRLSLDAATRVEVRMNEDRRELRLLAGRAKFDVAKDPLRPFMVMAGDKMVVATGTAFSVELLRRELRVLLYEGRVEVLPQSAVAEKEQAPVLAPASKVQSRQAPEISLLPGRELIATLAAPTATIVPADINRSLSWEDGQLSFDREPLPAAIERINRYSRERLVIADEALSGLRISGVFTAGNVDAFVEGVTTLLPVAVVREAGKLTMKRNETEKN